MNITNIAMLQNDLRNITDETHSVQFSSVQFSSFSYAACFDITRFFFIRETKWRHTTSRPTCHTFNSAV